MPKIEKKSDWTNLLTKKTKDFLTFHGCKVWRQNNIPVPGRAFFGEPGLADICGLTSTGIHIEVEVKTKGDKLSDDQVKHGKDILACNGIYLVVRDYSTWESLQNIFEKTNGSKRIPKTDRTEEEIRLYVQSVCEEILGKEKEWVEFSEARHEEQKEKARFKRQIQREIKNRPKG